MQREYQGFIFTKHAIERSQKRSISQHDVVQVLKYPEITQPTDKPANLKFIKTVGDRPIHVVATLLPREKKWLVVSVWVRGEDDQPSLAWRLLTLPFKLSFRVLQFLVTRVIKVLKAT